VKFDSVAVPGRVYKNLDYEFKWEQDDAAFSTPFAITLTYTVTANTH